MGKYTGKFPTLPKRTFFQKGDKGENVKLLQKLLNWMNQGAELTPLKVDGEIGNKTIGAVKFMEQVHCLKEDGEFGQKCLGCAKKLDMTDGVMAVNWAISIINDGSYHYKKWNAKDKKTQQCPICHKQKTGKYHGWNCIGFITACYHHGAGRKEFECSCSGLGSNEFFTKVTLASWRKHNGKKWIAITNGGTKGGNSIKEKSLKMGDVLTCYKSNGEYQHTAMYAGYGTYVDSTSGSNPNVGRRTYSKLANHLHVTRAFRPI